MVGHRYILYSILKFDHIKTATCIQKHTLTYSHVWTQKEATRIEQASILWIFDIPLFPSAKPLCWRFTYQGGIRQAVEASRGEARMDVATHTLIPTLKRERQVGPCESTASLTHIRVPGQPELHIETLKTKKTVKPSEKSPGHWSHILEGDIGSPALSSSFSPWP